MFVKPHAPDLVDAEAHTCSPAKAFWGAGDLANVDVHFHAGNSAELFRDEVGLEAPLRAELDVLPVTTSASAGAGVRTARRDAAGGRFDDLERVGAEVGLGLFGDRRQDPLAGKTVAHEHDTPVRGSCDTAAAGRDRASLELEQRTVVHNRTGLCPGRFLTGWRQWGSGGPGVGETTGGRLEL